MTKEQKALERDAARYRFLRSPKSRDDAGCSKRAIKVAVVDWAKKLDRTERHNFWSNMDVEGEAMDKAVDKAMRDKP